jgi:hypothetical protein
VYIFLGKCTWSLKDDDITKQGSFCCTQVGIWVGEETLLQLFWAIDRYLRAVEWMTTGSNSWLCAFDS